MKVSIVFVDEAEDFKNKGVISTEKALPFNLGADDDVSKVMVDALEACGMQKIPSNYSFQDNSTKNYLINFNTVKEGDILLITLNPVIRVKEWLSILENKDLLHLKKDIFKLRYYVSDVTFAEEFITAKGIDKLLNLIVNSTGNVQSYALTALRCFMGYYNGLQEFLESPELIDKLFYLVDDSVVATVSRQAVELLFVLCNYGGWALVNKAAKFTARVKGIDPYSNIIAMLDCGDLDTQLNALTLLNSLLENAPNKDKVKKLVTKWRDLDLASIILKIRKIQLPSFKTQFGIFESLAGEFIDAPTLTKAQQLEEYEAQQPLLQLLVSELAHCYRVIQTAQENGAYMSSKTPTKRYEKTKVWSRVDRPISLNFVHRDQTQIDPSSNMAEKLDRLSDYYKRRSQITFTRSINKSKDDQHDDQPLSPHSSSPSPRIDNINNNINNNIINNENLMSSNNNNNDNNNNNNESNKESNIGVNEEIKEEKVIERSENQQMEINKQIEQSPNQPDDNIPPPLDNNNNNTTTHNDDNNNNNNNNITIDEPQKQITLNEDNNNNSNNNNEIIITSEGGSNAPPPPPPPPMGGGPPPPPPPPGMGGGPPPPPPPPGGGPPPPPGLGGPPPLPSMAPRPTKPVITPTTKLKPLYWNRIIIDPSQSKNSFWATLPENMEIDIHELEDSFAVQVKAKKESNIESNNSNNKQKFVNILDPKRSNAIAIMISRLPESSVLLNAIHHLDHKVIKRDMIPMLLSNLPTDEELQLIRSSENKNFDKPELFCLEIAKIVNVKEILQCWDFSMSFKEKFADISPAIFLLANACKELKASESLPKTFALILSVGNYLNGGSNRGQADGFQLEFLPKLMDTKDNEGNPLMHYVIKMIHKKYPTLEKLPAELSHIKESSNISLSELSGRAEQLIGEFNLFKKRLQIVKENGQGGSNNQLFINEMNKFTEATEEKLKTMGEELADVGNKYRDLLAYFGTKNLQTPSEEFLFRISKFLEDFKNTLANLLREERKQSADDSKKRENIGKKIGGGIGGGDGDDPMSGIIAAIRAGKSSDLKKAELNINSPSDQSKEINFKAGLRSSRMDNKSSTPSAPSSNVVDFKANLRKVNIEPTQNAPPSDDSNAELKAKFNRLAGKSDE